MATPDGTPPQLDINGMGLAFHSIEKLGSTTAAITLEQRKKSFNINAYRRRHAELVERREQELQLLEHHLGRLSVSELLPASDGELTEFRPELIRRIEALPDKTYHSVESLVRRHRDPDDEFSFADFDFVHLPGGHAPIVDFRDDPWIGEALHLARESGVLLSLICHAPVALTSTWQRVDDDGEPYQLTANPFAGAKVSAASKLGERIALRAGYVHIRGKRVKLPYFVDEALEEAGFNVKRGLNPSAVKLLHELLLKLITGPQTIDVQAKKIHEVLSWSLDDVCSGELAM